MENNLTGEKKNWYYNKDIFENAFNIFQVGIDSETISIKRNIMLKNNNIYYEVNGSKVTDTSNLLPNKATSIEMIKDSIQIFEQLEICSGVHIKKLKEGNEQLKWKLLNCSEGFEDKGIWKSYSCSVALQPCKMKFPTEKKNTSCHDCRHLRDLSNKIVWNMNQIENTLKKCRTAKKRQSKVVIVNQKC